MQMSPDSSSMRLSCRVLIVGGGLAGLAAAIAITLAGHEVTIFERMPILQEIGAGIQLPPNATVLLKKWGVLDEIQSYGLEPEGANIRSYHDGAIISTLNFGPSVKESYAVPYILIHRADLHRVLLQRAQELGVVIRLNSDITAIGTDVSQPYIQLGSKETYQGDVILGADGERSVCREKLLGHQDPLRSSGDLIFRITVNAELVRQHQNLIDLVDPPSINYWMAPGSHAVSYVMTKDGLLNIILTIPQVSGDNVQYGVQKVDLPDLKRMCNGWDKKFEELLGIAQECSKWTLLQSNEISTWTHSAGRFTLIGDSAHAMPPWLAQGAAQGFEDAAVLGVLFSQIKRKSQLANALNVYERLRKPRAVEVGKRSRDMRNVFGMPDGPMQQERDHQISLGPLESSPISLADPVFQRWLWGYDASEEAEKAWEKFLEEE